MLETKKSNLLFTPKPPQTAQSVLPKVKQETQMRSTLSFGELPLPEELHQYQKQNQKQYNQSWERTCCSITTNFQTQNFNGNETLFDHSTSLAATLTRAVEEIIAQMRNVHSRAHHTRHVNLISELLSHEGAYGFTPSMLEAGITEMIAFFVNVVKEEKMSMNCNVPLITPTTDSSAVESVIEEEHMIGKEDDRVNKNDNNFRTSSDEHTDGEDVIAVKELQKWDSIHNEKSFLYNYTDTEHTTYRQQNVTESHCNIAKSCSVEHFLPPLIDAKYVKETQLKNTKTLLNELPALSTVMMAADDVQGNNVSYNHDLQSAIVDSNLCKTKTHKEVNTDNVMELEKAKCLDHSSAAEILLALIEHCTKPLIFLTLHDYQCLTSTLLQLYNVLGDILVNVEDDCTSMSNEAKSQKDLYSFRQQEEILERENYQECEHNGSEIRDKQQDMKNRLLYVIRIATLRCLHLLLSTYQNAQCGLFVNGERVTLKSMTLNDFNILSNSLPTKLCARWCQINKLLTRLERNYKHVQIRKYHLSKWEPEQEEEEEEEQKEELLSEVTLTREAEKKSHCVYSNSTVATNKDNLVASKIAEHESKLSSMNDKSNIKECMLTELICITRVCMVLVTCVDELKAKFATTSSSRLSSPLLQRANEMIANKLINECVVKCALDSITYCTQSIMHTQSTFTVLDKMCSELSLDLLITIIDISPKKLFEFLMSSTTVISISVKSIVKPLTVTSSSSSSSSSLQNLLLMFVNLSQKASHQLTELRNDCLLFFCKLLRAANKYRRQVVCAANINTKCKSYNVDEEITEHREELEKEELAQELLKMANNDSVESEERDKNAILLTRVLLVVAYYCSEQMRSWTRSKKKVQSMEEQTSVAFPLQSLLQSICASESNVQKWKDDDSKLLQAVPLAFLTESISESDVEYIRLSIQFLTDTCEWTSSSVSLYNYNSINVNDISEGYCYLVQQLMELLHFFVHIEETSSAIKKNVMSPEGRIDICNDALWSFSKLLNLTNAACNIHTSNDISSKLDVNKGNCVNVMNRETDKWDNACTKDENLPCAITHIASAHQLVLSYVVKSNFLQLCTAYAQVVAGNDQNSKGSSNSSSSNRLQPLHINATMMIATVCSHVCHSQCDKEITKQFLSRGANACVNVLLHNLIVLIEEVQVKDSITESEIMLALYCWNALASLLTPPQPPPQSHQQEQEKDAFFYLSLEHNVERTQIARLLADWLNTLHRLVARVLSDVLASFCFYDKLHELYLTLINVCQCVIQQSENGATEIFVKFIESKGVTALLNALFVHITFNALISSDKIKCKSNEVVNNTDKSYDDAHYNAMLAHQLMCQGSYSPHTTNTNHTLSVEQRDISELADNDTTTKSDNEFVHVTYEEFSNTEDNHASTPKAKVSSRLLQCYTLSKENINRIISLLLATITNAISHSMTITTLRENVITELMEWRYNSNNEDRSIVQVLIVQWKLLLQQSYVSNIETNRHNTSDSINDNRIYKIIHKDSDEKDAQECGLRVLGIDVRDYLRKELERLFTELQHHHIFQQEEKQENQQANNTKYNKKCVNTTNSKASALSTIQHRVYQVLKQKLHIFFDIYLLLNTIGFEHFYSVSTHVSRYECTINNNDNSNNSSNKDSNDSTLINKSKEHYSLLLSASERATLVQIASLPVLCEEELYLAMKRGTKVDMHIAKEDSITKENKSESNTDNTKKEKGDESVNAEMLQYHVQQSEENQVTVHSAAFMRPVSADNDVLQEQLRNIARQRHDISQLYELNEYFDSVQNNSEFEHYLLSRIRQPVAALNGWQTLSVQRCKDESCDVTTQQKGLLPPLMLSANLAARFATAEQQEEEQKEKEYLASQMNSCTLQHQNVHVLTNSWKKCCESTIASTLAATMQSRRCNDHANFLLTESNAPEHLHLSESKNNTEENVEDVKKLAQTAIVLPTTRSNFPRKLQQHTLKKGKDVFDKTNSCCYCKDNVLNNIIERQSKEAQVKYMQKSSTSVQTKSSTNTQKCWMTNNLNLSEQRRKKLAMIARSLKKMPEYDKIKKMNEHNTNSIKAYVAEELIDKVLHDVK